MALASRCSARLLRFTAALTDILEYRRQQRILVRLLCGLGRASKSIIATSEVNSTDPGTDGCPFILPEGNPALARRRGVLQA